MYHGLLSDFSNFFLKDFQSGRESDNQKADMLHM